MTIVAGDYSIEVTTKSGFTVNIYVLVYLQKIQYYERTLTVVHEFQEETFHSLDVSL